MQIGQVLRQPALRTPGRIAIVDAPRGEHVEITYAELDEDARRVAAALRARGIVPGERVALVADNCRAFVACWFGVVYAGCTVAPAPVVSAAPEVAFRLTDAGCAALITDEARGEMGERACAQAGGEVIRLDARELLRADVTPIDAPARTAPEDLAMILYTSGTLGAPKGAAITHASLMTHTAALVHHTLRLGAEDRVLGALPLTHSYGIRMVVLATFYASARAVLVPRFFVEQTLELLSVEGITWLPAVPTMFAAWANGPDGEPPSRLRWCLSAGAPLTEDVRTRAEARLGALIRQGYGLTEATFCTIDAPPWERVPGSVGHPVWGIEVRVVDDAGAPVPRGEDGEIVVRGQNVMRGYLGDAESTEAVMRDGWLHTGDVGRFDDNGRLWVVDRIKDLILRGGNNVYPSEVEDAIATHPAVAEVAVVGRPDEHYGEEVIAVLVLHEGATLEPADLAAHCRERIARNKVPREVAFVDALPIGPSRKVLKRELRAALASGELPTRPTRAGTW
ncbi:MAG: class I adenylate-forming enzyme family protein [Polyangiales bacterium]